MEILLLSLLTLLHHNKMNHNLKFFLLKSVSSQDHLGPVNMCNRETS